MKFILLAIGVFMLLATFIWPTILPSFSGISTLIKDVKIEPNGESAMFNLNYHGTNEDGQPFGVTAAKATRDMSKAKDDEKATINLTSPQADFTTKEGSFVALTADNGVYHEKQNDLELQGNVEIFHDNGSTFSAPQLSVDLDTNKAWTSTPVVVHGSFGEIEAEKGMEVIDGGRKVIFQGPSKARLTGDSMPGNTPAAAKTPDKPAEQ